MNLGIAADHGGFHLKDKLKPTLELNHKVYDFGAKTYDPQDDYPDCILPLANAIHYGTVVRGIAICGSGVGACIVSNKVKGVRAALINETYSAHQGVEHDDMNLLCLGARVVGETYAMEIVNAFLLAHYTADSRHERRLSKLKIIEQTSLK